MMKSILIGLLAILALSACTSSVKYKTLKKTDKNGYSYEQVTNDPLKTRIYTLKNGLKVYLSPNADEPRAMCLIGVRAGSTSEPLETTGLAHYFEHMMFKGTSKMGTVNWEEESKLIAQIEQLYEKHKTTSDPMEKKKIYAEIDRVSQEAAKYVATNEYDKLMSSIGAKGTNAGTDYESTVYMNDVPVNELEKWAILESERFHGIVLRLFHTELETVYEEFNMYQDRDSDRQFQTLMKNLFPTHPYGRDIVGFPEHLKNPSMINIQNFFKTFYVPNNMAVAISGDISFEETIKLIDKYFGNLEYKELPVKPEVKENPVSTVISKDVKGPEPENVMMAFRVGGIGSQDQPYFDVINMILSNNSAGLIDLNLVQKQKVLYAYSFYYALKEYGIMGFQSAPLQNQTLEEVKELLLAEIENIKKGNFDDWLVQAVVNDLKLQIIKRQENNGGRAYELMGNFTDELSREKAISYIDSLESLTKEDIVRFANEKFPENYVVVYKRQGENSELIKVEKPEITAVPVNREIQSEFAGEFAKMKSSDVEPVFVNFEEKIKKDKLKEKCDYYYIKNESNELFSLYYIVDMGKWHSLKTELAVGYLKYIGTDKFSAPDFQKELYKYGLTLDVSTDNERSYVMIKGLNANLDKGIELLEHILSNAKADSQAYSDYVGRILKDRSDQKTDQQSIINAMFRYGVYGDDNPVKYLLSENELKAVDPEELVKLIKEITTYEHKVFYFGPTEFKPAMAKLKEKHKLPEQLSDIPAPKQFKELVNEKSTAYVVDFDINQANILLVSNGKEFSKDLIPAARIYNEFYGSGLSSVVFQEIRESKALAYSAYSWYDMASKPGRLNNLVGYIGTQADKLPIATSSLIGLLENMPKAQSQYDMARESIVKKINTERITKDQIFWNWLDNSDLGINYDIRKDEYDAAKNMSIDDFEKFFNDNIKNQNYSYLIFGKKDILDQKALKSLGEVKELSIEDLFGY